MEDCIFCEIASGKKEHWKVWEDDQYVAFMDRRPMVPGHVLVVPRLHVDYLYDLPTDVYDGLFERVKLLSGPLKLATGASRISLAVDGFGVPHVHIHMLPLNHGSELNRNNAHEVSESELDAMAQNIKSHL